MIFPDVGPSPPSFVAPTLNSYIVFGSKPLIVTDVIGVMLSVSSTELSNFLRNLYGYPVIAPRLFVQGISSQDTVKLELVMA